MSHLNFQPKFVTYAVLRNIINFKRKVYMQLKPMAFNIYREHLHTFTGLLCMQQYISNLQTRDTKIIIY